MQNRQTMQIGLRLRAARERARMTQQDLAARLGFEHRQTLASVEVGERRLTAEELVRIISVLRVDLDYFTDSFRLVGEGRFSFRAAGVTAGVLDQFENQAGCWIATYRELRAQQGEEPRWLDNKLALTPRSSFEEAQSAAEAVVTRWQLGERPAEVLHSAIEHQLDALVLYVDAPSGISGAASQVPGVNAVLVNRRESEGRRSFDLAHELFHLLTWDVMPPDRVEAVDVPRGGKAKRVEQLAENFAGALLMPGDVMRPRWDTRDSSTDMHDWLNRTAEDMRVTALAAKWRLHVLGCLSKADLLDINDKRLVANGRPTGAAPHIPAFSKPFMERIATALDAGRLSVKRAAALLAVSPGELAALLREHGFEPSFDT